jgi:hypothetical protein
VQRLEGYATEDAPVAPVSDAGQTAAWRSGSQARRPCPIRGAGDRAVAWRCRKAAPLELGCPVAPSGSVAGPQSSRNNVSGRGLPHRPRRRALVCRFKHLGGDLAGLQALQRWQTGCKQVVVVTACRCPWGRRRSGACQVPCCCPHGEGLCHRRLARGCRSWKPNGLAALYLRPGPRRLQLLRMRI